MRVWYLLMLLMGSAGSPALAEELHLLRYFPGVQLNQPVAMVQLAEGAMPSWLIVERQGRILLVEGDNRRAQASLFADLRQQVEAGPGEAGLLGIALHPRFTKNRLLYLSYTRRGAPLVSVIARYRVAQDLRRLEPATAETLLEVAQPYGNHNGGNIGFGPDGYLYIGFGDGGAAGDPRGNAQNLQTLLGKMVRIDVDRDRPYAIPPDNPFSKGGGRAEIYAWGLRNPWRWSFDRRSGLLWAGDVGQNRWEEIDIIRKGGNYGWNRREGNHCYLAGECDAEGLVGPVVEYGHELGCSVTGGYVYHGSTLGNWRGHYFYSDYCSGKLWALDSALNNAAPVVVLETGLRISSFAEGRDGELYLLDIAQGAVYRLVP